jgi:hypothetical protein
MRNCRNFNKPFPQTELVDHGVNAGVGRIETGGGRFRYRFPFPWWAPESARG